MYVDLFVVLLYGRGSTGLCLSGDKTLRWTNCVLVASTTCPRSPSAPMLQALRRQLQSLLWTGPGWSPLVGDRPRVSCSGRSLNARFSASNSGAPPRQVPLCAIYFRRVLFLPTIRMYVVSPGISSEKKLLLFFP